MPDLSTQLTQISPSQGAKEVTANGLFDALGHLVIGARRAEGCLGLTWGYYGARWGGTLVANGTLTLTATATNYIVIHRTTGAITASATTTNWADQTTYGRLYKVTTGASAVTDYQDHRCGPGGPFSTATAP